MLNLFNLQLWRKTSHINKMKTITEARVRQKQSVICKELFSLSSAVRSTVFLCEHLFAFPVD